MIRVSIPNVGIIEFPEGMSDDDIAKAIETDIIPNYSTPSTTSPKPAGMNEVSKGPLPVASRGMEELRERYKETLFDASPSKQTEPSSNGSLVANAFKNMGSNWLSSKGAMELLRAAETGQAANMGNAQDVISLPRQGIAPLSPVEEALKLRELSARQTGDVETAKKNRDALMGRVAGMEESALSKLESGRDMHVDYDLPDNELAAKTLQAIESAGFTAESAAKAGAGWALGGPLGGALMGISNTLTEAETEAGSVFLEMLKNGASPEEIKNAMRIVRGGNIAMLPFMNATGDVVSFGLDKGLEAASKRIVGDKLTHKLARTALKKGVPYVANSMIEGGEEFGQETIAQKAQGKPFDKQEAMEAAKVGALSGLLYTLVGRGSREAMSRITGLEKQARRESPKDQRRAYVDIFERMENGDVSIQEIVPLLTARQKLEIVSNAVLEFKDLRQRQRGGESLDSEQTKKLSTLSNAIGLLSSEGEDAALIKMSETMDIPSWIRERSSTDLDSHVYRGGLDEGLFINSDETAIVPKGDATPAVKEPTAKSIVPVGEAHRPLSDMTLDNATLYTSSEIEANRTRLERSLGKMTKAQIREQFGVVSNRGDKRDNLISKVIDGLKTEADKAHSEKGPRSIPMGGELRGDTIIEQPSQRVPMLPEGAKTPGQRRDFAQIPTRGAIVAEGQTDPLAGELEVDSRPGTERGDARLQEAARRKAIERKIADDEARFNLPALSEGPRNPRDRRDFAQTPTRGAIPAGSGGEAKGVPAEDLSRLAEHSVPGIDGNPSQIKVKPGESIDVIYRVIDANDLVPSHTKTFDENPAYPAELQPRDRSRDGYVAQVEGMAGNLDPDLLMDSLTPAVGAPIVKGGVVESGNGRALAIQKAYDSGNAGKYKAAIIDRAIKLGIDPEAVSRMEMPVLVRERTTETNRTRFAEVANESLAAKMGASEQAVVDAKRITPELMSGIQQAEEGKSFTKANRQFVKDFFQHVVPKEDHNAIIQKNGELSLEGERRVINAVFAKAYGDADLVSRISERTDYDSKNLTNALISNAPSFAQVSAKASSEAVHPTLDLASDVAKAAHEYSKIKDNGEHISDHFKQGDMFGDQSVSPEVEVLTRVFDNMARSSKRLSAFLNNYNEAVLSAGSPRDTALFGDARTPTKMELIEAAARKVEQDHGLEPTDLGERANTNVVEEDTRVIQEESTGSRESTHEQDGKRKPEDPGEIEPYDDSGYDLLPEPTRDDFDTDEEYESALSEWEEESGEGERYQVARQDDNTKITKNSIEKSFPGATVTEQDGGSFVVKTPNGQRITVHPDATITMNKKSASEAYGREMNDSDEAVGSFQSVNGEGVIRLTEKADQGTLDHETWHAAKAFAISEEDAAVLKKDYANEEQEAEAYRQWVAGRRMKTTKRSGRIFQKILDFFKSIKDNLFGRDSWDVFSDVASGRAWEGSQKDSSHRDDFHASISENRRAPKKTQGAMEQLKSDAKAFAQSIDDFLNGKLMRRKTVKVMTTPLVLKLAGAEVLPVTIKPATLDKILRGKHSGKITPELMKQLPEALADPIMVLKLEPNGRRPGNSLLTMLGIKDNSGNTINTAILLSKKLESGGSKYVNQINTVFGREFVGGGANDGWFIKEASKSFKNSQGEREAQLKYLNVKKASLWARQLGQDWPEGRLKEKLSTENIPTEKDLVKLREENPPLYQVKEANSDTSETVKFGDHVVMELPFPGQEIRQSINKMPKVSKEDFEDRVRKMLEDGWVIVEGKKEPKSKAQPSSKPEAQPQDSDTSETREPIDPEAEAKAKWEAILEEVDGERVVEKTKEDRTLKQKTIDGLHELYSAFVDSSHPLYRYFGKGIDHLVRASPVGKSKVMVEKGTRDGKVRGLIEIFGDLPAGEANGFLTYAVYKHLMDIARNGDAVRATQTELRSQMAKNNKEASIREAKARKLPKKDAVRKTLLSEASEFKKQAEAAKAKAEALEGVVKRTKLKAPQYAWGIAELEKQYPHWKELQQDVVRYSNELLSRLEKGGMVSSELKAELERIYPNYIPLGRDFDTEEALNTFVRTRGMVNLPNPLKTLKGSDKDIVNPVDQLVENTFRIHSLLARNAVGQEVIRASEAGEIPEGVIVPAPDRYHTPDEHVFNVWKDGKRELYKTDKDVYSALMMLNGAGSGKDNMLTKFFKAPTSLVRFTATRSLSFMARNTFRDTWGAGVLSDVKFLPFVGSAKGAQHVINKTDLFYEYLENADMATVGGETGTLADLVSRIKEHDQKGIVPSTVAKKYIRGLDHLLSVSELSTRVGEYMAAKESGLSAAEAGLIARDRQDFSRAGYLGRTINQYVPFFNATVQGIDRVLRAHGTGDMIKAFSETEGPVKATAKALAAFRWKTALKGVAHITLPVLAAVAYNLIDDDRRETYMELPAWKRDLFLNIVIEPMNKKTGKPGKILTLPKPFTVGTVYGSIPERYLAWLYTRDKRAFDGITETLAQMGPTTIPPIVQISQELAMNKSMFSGRDIVPPGEQKLSPEFQYGVGTSEFAKWGGKITGVSPRKIDHVYRGLFTTVGQTVLDASDVAVRAQKDKSRPARKDWYEYASLSFLRDSDRSYSSVQNFYEQLSSVETAYHDAKFKVEKESPQSLTQKDKRALAMGQGHFLTAMRRSKRQIGELGRRKNGILEKVGMDKEEKERRIEQLDAQILQIAKSSLRSLDAAMERIEGGGR